VTSQEYKNPPKKIQKMMVWILPNSILFTHNIVLLVTKDKFDLNPIMVNINKLKPYKFLDSNPKD